ncbi:MAG TPA: DUF885 domain-containing protein [Vitreimonas sp.]|nr:DUF885 domain-containing protein [Vitreimonas sp.]
MLDRRALLFAGASALAGCASASRGASIPTETDAELSDIELRRLVIRLAERSRASRGFVLRRFDARRLTPEGRILYDAILPGAEADAVLARRAWGVNALPYAVTHRYGAYRRAAEMREEDDPARSALQVHDDTNRMAGDAQRRVIAPDFLLDATIPAVEAAAAHVLAQEGGRYEPLAHGLTRQLEVLRALRARAPSDAGVWQFPDGDAFYAQTLHFHFGAPIDPGAAHELALARARELQAEADAVMRAQGLTHGDVAQRLRGLLADPRRLTALDDAGKTAAVADMNASLARARVVLAPVIEGVADAPAEVRRLPASREANGAQGQRNGAIYYVDLGAARPRWTLPSVVHHELIPGHILQTPYENFADPPELQTRYASGYSEGWATYAEQLADEAGAFAEDPMARLGYLHWMLFRMARVVADAGIHALRWSRQRAVDEMRALQGDSVAFVSIEDDVVRICAQPGAYAAQGLAALHIAQLRARTQREAGAAFDAKRFHTAMLRFGPLSPPGLDQAARTAFRA